MNDIMRLENPKYEKMVEKIKSQYPMVQKASEAFHKTQSQFMDSMLTVSQPTPLRSLRQICAEIEKSKQALDEARFKLRKKLVNIEKKKNKLTIEANQFKRALLEIEIEELENQIETTQKYIGGAIRKVSAYLSQYQSILAKYGKTEFSEEDFEREECRYHIMTAFHQALTAARSHGGVIDEGNHIYFFQIGISGAAAQAEIFSLLTEEGKMLSNDIYPDHSMILEWLERMASKYEDAPKRYAQRMGKQLIDDRSLYRSITHD